MGVLQSPRTMRVIIYEALGNICRCRSIHTLCKIDFVRNFGALKMKYALFVSLETFKAFVLLSSLSSSQNTMCQRDVDTVAAAVPRGSGFEGLALRLALFISPFMYLERKTVQCHHFLLKTVITSCPGARQRLTLRRTPSALATLPTLSRPGFPGKPFLTEMSKGGSALTHTPSGMPQSP